MCRNARLCAATFMLVSGALTAQVPVEDRGPVINVAVSPAIDEQDSDVAYSAVSDLFFVVWKQPVLNNVTQIHGAFLSPAGASAAPFQPFQISAGVQNAMSPAVAWDADLDSFLVVWCVIGNPTIVFGRRVGPGGVMPGPAFPILVPFQPPPPAPPGLLSFAAPDVAYSQGDGEFLVVAAASGPIGANPPAYGQRVAGPPGGGAGNLTSPELFCAPFAIGPNGMGKVSVPAVAYSRTSNHFLVVWEWAAASLNVSGHVVRLNPLPAGLCPAASATLFPGMPIMIAVGALHEDRPDVAWNSQHDDFLVVFRTRLVPETCQIQICVPNPFGGCNWIPGTVNVSLDRIQGRRISGAAAVLGGNPLVTAIFTISDALACTAFGQQTALVYPDAPRVAANSSTDDHLLVAWAEGPLPAMPAPPRNVRARTLKGAVQPVLGGPAIQHFDGASFAPASTGKDEYEPCVDYGEGRNQFLVGFTEGTVPIPGNLDIRAQRVSGASIYPDLAVSHNGFPSAGASVEITIQGATADLGFILWFVAGPANGAPPVCANPFLPGAIGAVLDLAPNGVFIPDPYDPDGTYTMAVPAPDPLLGSLFTLQALTVPPAGAWLLTGCRPLSL